MNRTVNIYLVLLIGLLTASYLSWTAEDVGEPEDGVVLVAGDSESLAGLKWTSEKLNVYIEVRNDEIGRYLWVDLVEIKEKPKPKDDPADVIADEPESPAVDDDHSDEAHEAHEAPAEEEAEEEAPVEMVREETKKAFLAGAAGQKMLDSLAPLTARRQINVADDKVAEFGLDEPDAILTLHRNGKPDRVLEIGGEAYGIKDRYVRDTESGKVYLVDNQIFKPLQFAKSRLPERNLIPTDKDEVVQVEVMSLGGNEKVTLEHKNRDDKDAAFWAMPGTEVANDVAEAWLDKVFRLRSAGFVQSEDVPTGLETAFTLTATAEDGTTTQVTVSKGNNPDGKETWYGKSTHTRELVKLHKVLASEAAEDLSTVFSSEPVEESSEG